MFVLSTVTRESFCPTSSELKPEKYAEGQVVTGDDSQ